MPFKKYLRNKLQMLNLYLNLDVALENSFPGTGTWHLSVVLLMLFHTWSVGGPNLLTEKVVTSE